MTLKCRQCWYHMKPEDEEFKIRGVEEVFCSKGCIDRFTALNQIGDRQPEDVGVRPTSCASCLKIVDNPLHMYRYPSIDFCSGNCSDVFQAWQEAKGKPDKSSIKATSIETLLEIVKNPSIEHHGTKIAIELIGRLLEREFGGES